MSTIVPNARAQRYQQADEICQREVRACLCRVSRRSRVHAKFTRSVFPATPHQKLTSLHAERAAHT